MCSGASTTRFLSRAIAEDVFEPYESPELGALDPARVELVPGHEVTPVDTGDVCINIDNEWFAEPGLHPAGDARRPRRPELQGLSSSRTRRRPRPVWPSCWRRWPTSATTASSLWSDAARPTAWRSSTAGTTAYYASSPQVVVTATDRSWSATHRAHRPTIVFAEDRSRPSRRRRHSTRRASGRSSSPACCGARTEDEAPPTDRLPGGRGACRASCR